MSNVATSRGRSTKTVGKVKGPLICIFNEGTQVEARTIRPESTEFFVMEDVSHLYYVILSTHVAHDWGNTVKKPRVISAFMSFRNAFMNHKREREHFEAFQTVL